MTTAPTADLVSLMQLSIDGSRDPVFWLREDGTLEYVNEAGCRVLDYERDELLSMSILDVDPSVSSGRWPGRWAELKEAGFLRFETRYRASDGRGVPVEVAANHVAFGGREYAFAHARDITEQKAAELELSVYREHLEDLVRARTRDLEAANDELQAFAYSVSHDLRAPLRAIHGYAEILGEEYGPGLDEEGMRLLNVIQDNASFMGGLIDDLLELSRVGRAGLQPETVDMGEIVDRVVFGLMAADPSADRRVEVGRLPSATCDATLIRQVWANLLSNAFKFCAPRRPGVVEVSGEIRGEECVYAVRDNGVGFDMDHRDKLFRVFERLHTREEFEGTGVGLAIVDRIVGRHGGRVWAEAGVDEGATFRFTLPRNGGGS